MITATNQSELQVVEWNIQRLEDTKHQLTLKLREVEREIDTEKAKYAVLRNSQTPALQLPQELMSAIFRIAHDEALDLSANYGQRCLLSLARICSRWRHIILTTSLLWNRISMSFGEGISPMNYVRLDSYLQRSGDCFLDMTFKFYHCRDSSFGFWQLISRHCARWRRLSIYIMVAESMLFTIDFSGLQTPALEHFSFIVRAIQSGGPESPRKNYNISNDAHIRPPRLRFLRLGGGALGEIGVQSASIQTLHLDGWSRSYMTWKQLKNMLESLPELKDLSLFRLCIRHSGGPLEGPKSIDLGELRSLRIHDPYTPVDMILPLFNTHNLEHLFLQKVDSVQVKTMPTLIGLHLEQARLDTSYVTMFITMAPNITTLSIDDCSYAALADNLARAQEDNDQDTPIAWPHLRSLNVRQLSGIDVNHLVRVVISRQSLTESRLDTVTLDRRSRTTLRTKHRLDMLADQVGIQNHDTLERWPPGLGYDDPHDLEY